jgi:hypothetical protein
MFDDATPAFDTYICCHFVETFLVQTCTHSESGRLKSPPFCVPKKEESAMIASYQLIINVIADYIEIVMLSIGMIVFLASE